jgi:hypothetical protein
MKNEEDVSAVEHKEKAQDRVQSKNVNKGRKTAFAEKAQEGAQTSHRITA